MNAIRVVGTASRVEILLAEHGVSCWKVIKWTRLVYSVSKIALKTLSTKIVFPCEISI